MGGRVGESERVQESRGGNGLLGWSLGFGVLCCKLAVRASGLYYDYFREAARRLV
jgi:hypothetical protein